jgi:hypothetical protein
MSDNHVINASEILTRLEENEDGHARITPEHTIADVLRYLVRTNSYGDVLNTLLMLEREESEPLKAAAERALQNVYPHSKGTSELKR